MEWNLEILSNFGGEWAKVNFLSPHLNHDKPLPPPLVLMIIQIKDLNESWTRYDIYICKEQASKIWTQKLFTCKVITVSYRTKNYAIQEVTKHN